MLQVVIIAEGETGFSFLVYRLPKSRGVLKT